MVLWNESEYKALLNNNEDDVTIPVSEDNALKSNNITNNGRVMSGGKYYSSFSVDKMEEAEDFVYRYDSTNNISLLNNQLESFSSHNESDHSHQEKQEPQIPYDDIKFELSTSIDASHKYSTYYLSMQKYQFDSNEKLLKLIGLNDMRDPPISLNETTNVKPDLRRNLQSFIRAIRIFTQRIKLKQLNSKKIDRPRQYLSNLSKSNIFDNLYGTFIIGSVLSGFIISFNLLSEYIIASWLVLWNLLISTLPWLKQREEIIKQFTYPLLVICVLLSQIVTMFNKRKIKYRNSFHRPGYKVVEKNGNTYFLKT